MDYTNQTNHSGALYPRNTLKLTTVWGSNILIGTAFTLGIVSKMTSQQSHVSESATQATSPLSEAERNAMRSYLQRSEVRLSTLHRIATAFISGAGLLLLIPVFFKDAIDTIISIVLTQAANLFPHLGIRGLLVTGLMYLVIFYPLLLSLSIPLYGVYLLLKDMVHFYFTIYTPGFSENLLNPTFALTGIMFSTDESKQAKHEAMHYQYETTQMGFMIPFSKERHELYFDKIIEKTNGHIIPESRRLEKLQDQSVLPPNYDEQSVRRFNAALGIARSLDRTLAQEVAVTEMALVRHVLYLRRLMLRYVKTLLMFIWTTVISFMMLPFLKDERFPTMIVLALGYLVWSLAVLRIIRWPLYWLYRHRHADINFDQVDPQLTFMEENIRKFCYVSIAASFIGLILAVAGYLY